MLIACLLTLASLASAAQLCHSFSYGNVYFDLNGGQTKDRVQTVKFTDQTATLYYNLCEDVSQVCSLKTTLPNGTIQVLDYSGPGTLVFPTRCIPFIKIDSSNLYNTQNLSSSYVINYTSAPVPNEDNTTTTYTLMLVNPCNTSLTSQILSNNTFIIISELPGCPILDLTTIWSYFEQHKFAFFLTTLIFGVIMMLLGLYMYRITIWLVGGLAGFGILLLIESVIVFLPGVPNSLINSIVIITGITSIFIGYVTLYFPKLGTFGLGAWIGVILSFILNNIALYRIKSNISTLPLLITLGVLAISFGILALFFKKSFIIISTSFIGAYCSIRALSWYLGAFPNEFLIAKQVRYSSGVGVQWQYYIYVVALFILTGSSMSIQFWLFRKRAKLLGKSTDIDEYVNQINQEIDQERSKYLVFENVFKKKRKKSVEPRYLEKKRGQGSNSESNYSSEKRSSSQEQQESEEEEEQQMKEAPKRIVKFQKANFNKNTTQNKNQHQQKNGKKTAKSSSSQKSSPESKSESEQQQSEQQSEKNYKNAKKREPQSRRSLKQKLIQKQQTKKR